VSELVVGEAVVLELRLAKLASRSLALALDLAAQLLLLIVGSFVVIGVVVQVDDALGAAMALVFYLAVILGYPVAFETLSRGRSLGKMALGLRVVREDGGPIRFRHALVRGLLGVVEFWIMFGSVALITSLASARGKRVGDFLAGTVVVRERMPAQGAPVAAMPPPLAGWATTLDLGRVPDDLALAARQFLGRFQDLAPEVRESMGSRLGAAMAAVTTPPPPPGVPAWAFLSAVLAERRRREMARMMPPTGYQPMSPYGGHYPVAQQPPMPPQPSPIPPYGWQYPVAPQHVPPQQVAPQTIAGPPVEEAPPQRDGNPFTPPS
jgi:uncharacterized RDD family membrane protein YckC